MTHDRGAFQRVTFVRAARGFVLYGENGRGLESPMFAFDRIEDVGAWFIEQYSDPPHPDCSTNPEAA